MIPMLLLVTEPFPLQAPVMAMPLLLPSPLVLLRPPLLQLKLVPRLLPLVPSVLLPPDA